MALRVLLQAVGKNVGAILADRLVVVVAAAVVGVGVVVVVWGEMSWRLKVL